MSELVQFNTNQQNEQVRTRLIYSSDSEIESIESTYKFARNHKLPTRYIGPRNTCNTESNVTSYDTSLLLSSNSVSNSNSSKRTHDEMEAENKEEEDENKDDNEEEDDNISGLQGDIDMDDDDNSVEVDAVGDEGNDSNNVLHNTSRKGMKWTAEEDAIILHERGSEKGIRFYTTRAANRLKGRSVESVKTRWKRCLKKHHADTRVRWTAEEDAIILRERESGVKGYPARSANHLKGRSVEAVIVRHCHLKKHHAADASLRALVRWTAEEDAIILRARENKAKGYSTRAVEYLEGRGAQAVRDRYRYLKHHAAETQASTAAP